MKRYYLICNPSSKSFRARKLIAKYQHILKAKGLDFASGFTQKKGHATHLTRQAIKNGYDVIVAIGGDGTINEVLNGFSDPNGTFSDREMGVLYAGTSPDFCRFHAIPTKPEKAVELLVSSPARHIDVGYIKGDAEKHLFGCSCNLGIGAGIADGANRRRKYLGDFLGTLSAAVTTIIRSRPFDSELIVDGEPLSLPAITNLTFGKNPYLASGLKVNIEITDNDQKLYLFAVNNISILSLLANLPKLYSGKIVDDPRFASRKFSKVKLTSLSQPIKVEFDGDTTAFVPIEVGIIPAAIRLIKPHKSRR